MRFVDSRSILALALLGLTACAAGAATESPVVNAPPASAPAATASEAPTWTVPSLPPAAPIAAAEYAERREGLTAAMEEGVFVAFGAPAPEADYLTFFQGSPFRYLTGINEPDAALVIVKSGGNVEQTLFVQPRNPEREVWEGERLGAEGAEALTGIPARTVDQLMPTLDSLLAEHSTLYTLVPGPAQVREGEPLSPAQQALAQLAAEHSGTQIVTLDDAVQRLRAGKSPTELDLLRRAIYITVLAQRAAMRTIEPGVNEFEIQALIEYVFRRNGAERPGFATIVGSGPNSTTLHYNADDRYMEAGDMVVMDIGAAYRGYSADVTRTVPVSGEFTPEQEDIYEIVLTAQKAAEEQARPGATWEDLDGAANRVLTQGLAQLGLIDAPDATFDCENPQTNNQCPQYRLYYMHGLGHGIGLDVHDPDLSYFGTFDVGSAFTIEPGIYVRSDVLDYLPDTPENRAMIERLRPAVEQYENIGVRIEDDYFITSTGVERISDGAPREIEEIETLMALEPVGPERRTEVIDWYRQTEPNRTP